MTLEFHEPDSRWEAFGCDTYEKYLETYLIRGKFHAKVPQDVLDSYQTIEYLMAHAYYFYPLYDEAQSKLLRTVEMAIKHRCRELNINTTEESLNPKKRPRKRELFKLIELLNEAEPAKNLKPVLDWIRQIRNSSMHPEFNSYYGPMGMRSIKTGINTLNTLFASNEYFEKINTRLKEIQKKLEDFRKKPLVIEGLQRPFLLWDFESTELFLENEEPVYCLVFQPILKLKKSQEENFSCAHPGTIHAKNLKIENEVITGYDILSAKNFQVYQTDHLENIKQYEYYRGILEKNKIGTSFSYEPFISSKKWDAIENFRYSFFHQL